MPKLIIVTMCSHAFQWRLLWLLGLLSLFWGCSGGIAVSTSERNVASAVHMSGTSAQEPRVWKQVAADFYQHSATGHDANKH